MRKIGVLLPYNRETDLAAEINKIRSLELDTAQLCIWDTGIFTDDAHAKKIRSILDETNFEITALWAGFSGPCEWNFTDGPSTIGLVPPAYRSDG